MLMQGVNKYFLVQNVFCNQFPIKTFAFCLKYLTHFFDLNTYFNSNLYLSKNSINCIKLFSVYTSVSSQALALGVCKLGNNILSSIDVCEHDKVIYIVLASPLIEEIIFRGLIQEYLFRRFPIKIINSIDPEYAWIIDCYLAKTFRLLGSSILFALAHDHLEEVSLQLIIGLWLGFLTEVNDGDITSSIVNHIAYNTLLISLINFGSIELN